MSSIKKIKKSYVISIFAIITLLVAGNIYSRSDVVLAGGRTTEQWSSRSDFSTSTYIYMTTTATASTTAETTLGGSESFDFNVCALASTSAAVIDGSLWFAFEQDNPTWFQATNATVDSSSSLTFSSYNFHQSLATSSLGTNYTCLNILTFPVGAKRAKIKMGVSGSNTGIWWGFVPKLGL